MEKDSTQRFLISILIILGMAAPFTSTALQAAPFLPDAGPVYFQFDNKEQLDVAVDDGVPRNGTSSCPGCSGQAEGNWGVAQVSILREGVPVPAAAIAGDPDNDIASLGTFPQFVDQLTPTASNQVTAMFHGITHSSISAVGTVVTISSDAGVIDLYYDEPGLNAAPTSGLGGGGGSIVAIQDAVPGDRSSDAGYAGFTDGVFLARLKFSSGIDPSDANAVVVGTVDTSLANNSGSSDAYAEVVDVNGDGVIDDNDGLWASTLDSDWFGTVFGTRDVRFSTKLDINTDWDGGTDILGLTSNDPGRAFAVTPEITAALGDFVWEDLDADGIQDAGEPGIGGVTVNLLTPGGDGECDTGDEVFEATTTTDAAGLYLFVNLTPGRYCVEFDKPSVGDQLQCLDFIGGVQSSPQNVGADDTIDSDANPITGQTGNIDLNAGDNDLTNDAGFYCPAKIGDVLFNDLNHNGIQEPLLGETGFTPPGFPPGQLVELVECVGGVPGAVIDHQYTDGSGMYMFNPLPPGEYAVIFSKPADYVFSPKDQGTDETVDCDTDATGATECVTLGPNEYNPNVDACIYMPPPECDLVVDKTCAVSEPPTSDFTCEKPIDELSMIWTGPQDNVRVIAYKGDTSAPILANIAGILIGQTVVVSGYAGSPNDVIWEIFDASEVKIGESTFHLSCSDKGMNGPEDCGMPQGDGKDGKCPKGFPRGTDCSALFLNQWLLEGMVDSVGELTCSNGGTPPADFPTADSCSFTTASADVTYGYVVTNNGDPLTGVTVTDNQPVVPNPVGGPVPLATGESAQFTAMSTISGTTTNVATATGTLADDESCTATAELTVEKVVQPGSCDDGKATELVFEYTGDPCSATTNYQLDNRGKAKFKCSPTPGVSLAALSSVAFTKDADKLTAAITGNMLRIFRSDTLGEKLAAETKYVLTDINGDEQAQTLHTSCSKPLVVGDQFGALKLIQIVNEF